MASETDTAPGPTRAPSGILVGEYLWITIGACALVFLGAFESLAVTTVMPVVSADLGGERLYALAFAGPLATGVIGMVVAGNWSDRRGPSAPLYTSVAAFVVGLLVAGFASTMEIFVVARFAQGLGSGAMTVALYVVVARVYPKDRLPAIFAAFAAAWVVPSLIGPTVAGFVTELLSWHWVFLGVVVLVVFALLMVVPALKGLSREGDSAAPWALGRLGWAVLAAIAVLVLNLTGDVPAVGPALAAVAIVIALIAVRPLVPKGALLVRRGLPAVIFVRAVVAAAFFATQIYLPYLLVDEYAFTPTLAGLVLTGAALAWSTASMVQGKLGMRLASERAVLIGTALVLSGVAVVLVATTLVLSPVVIFAAWVFAGAGMGLASPRLSTLILSMSTPEDQGFNSSAMTVADSFGTALALAVTGVLFAALSAGGYGFIVVFGLAALLALVAVVAAPRVQNSGRTGDFRRSGPDSGAAVVNSPEL
ncbi:MFS transporter [Microbacterium sp. Mu-80]|uniref:MFS transporter n=1 Tax=Microbacterium bandirmense TaxID=3122050 RepID=A0ABU8LCS1_9MICO